MQTFSDFYLEFCIQKFSEATVILTFPDRMQNVFDSKSCEALSHTKPRRSLISLTTISDYEL